MDAHDASVTVCCGKRCKIEDIARPAAVLSLFIFISLSVLAALHLGWGIVFIMTLGFVVYGLVFGALFYKKSVRLFLAMFVVFESFKVVFLFGALLLGIVSVVEKYTDLNVELVVSASVYFPLNLLVLWVFYKYYKVVSAAERASGIAEIRREVEAPPHEIDRPPNYHNAIADYLERQSQSSQLPSYDDVVKGKPDKVTVVEKDV